MGEVQARGGIHDSQKTECPLSLKTYVFGESMSSIQDCRDSDAKIIKMKESIPLSQV